MEKTDQVTGLSNIKWLEMGEDLKEFRPAEPPTNFQLALLPKVGIRVLGPILLIVGICVAEHLLRNVSSYSNGLPVCLASVIVALIGAYVMYFAKEWTEVPLRGIISLLPRSLWRVMQEKAETIASLQKEADAFDARVAAFETAESFSRNWVPLVVLANFPSQAEALEKERTVMASRIDELLKELREAEEIDERRHAFFLTLKGRRRPGWQRDTDGQALDIAETLVLSNLREACETFGVKTKLLMRYVPYLR